MIEPRDVVTVSGPDARRYLHSQLSQDIESMAVGESRWTLVLAPTGRIEVLARVHCISGDTFELDTDVGFAPTLEARLARFKIRVAAELATTTRDVDTSDLVGWWNTPAASGADAARVTAGWPAMGAEIIPGETIPAETGLTTVAVNFTKGCYPGQELVERMDSRGAQAPRQLHLFDLDGQLDAVSPGDAILDDAGAEVGAYTSVAGGQALGYVRRGSAVGGTQVPVTTA